MENCDNNIVPSFISQVHLGMQNSAVNQALGLLGHLAEVSYRGAGPGLLSYELFPLRFLINE